MYASVIPMKASARFAGAFFVFTRMKNRAANEKAARSMPGGLRVKMIRR
jgi:hypothetical protein